jgi:hypothetical protein
MWRSGGIDVSSLLGRVEAMEQAVDQSVRRSLDENAR